MTGLALILAIFLLANLLVALLRVMGRPTPADCMLAALLFGTTGVALLLLLAYAEDAPVLVDIALTLALLGSVIGVAFVQRGWNREWEEENGRS
jgi:multicomponent Na+:H+ antiporter subunit F